MHRESLIKTLFIFEFNIDFDNKIHCFRFKIEWSFKSFHQFRDIKMTMRLILCNQNH